MHDTPTVTAVIATYRRPEYVREAICSALAQAGVDVEVLVSDDAADPDIRRLVESLDDNRIRYQSNPTCLGHAGNHRVAMLAARGRYIAVLNDDDIWRPDWLSTAVAVLENTPDAVLVFCDHDLMDPAGDLLPSIRNA